MRRDYKFANKIISLTIAILFILLGLTACSGGSGTSPDPEDEGAGGGDKLSIVTTIFPEYDWVRNIAGDLAGDNVEITLLMNNGVDLHSYQATAGDVIKIKNCDMLIYVGGESSKWIDDALREDDNADRVVIDLLDVLGDRSVEEETVEGMEPESEEGSGEESEEEEPEYDEHVWLSLRNAEIFCKEIDAKLEDLDPENAGVYAANTAEYISKLEELDKQYSGMVSSAAVKTLLFGDRFPFRYMVDDYGLDYYAAFNGCSAESEASFETIIFLADKVDELGLKYVIVTDGRDDKIAKTIIENTAGKDQEIAMLDSMQTKTLKDIDNGVTYLSVMQDDLNVLQKVLN